jgi:hypothetical protein
MDALEFGDRLGFGVLLTSGHRAQADLRCIAFARLSLL